MNSVPSRVLFVPASGPTGTGEYYRCLAMARAMADRRPELEVHFVLSVQADVEREEGFHYHLIEDTPSFSPEAVRSVIARLRPHLALFDCTGRVQHFRAVKACGGKLAWTSNRPWKRFRGFRPRTLRLLDLHLMIDTGNPAPELHLHERMLLKAFRQVRTEFISTIATEPSPQALEPWRGRLNATDGYAVFASGGGGWTHKGRPVPELFLDAAVSFRRASDRKSIVVMGPQYRGSVDAHPEVTVLGSLPTDALGALLADSRLLVIGGGNMLSSQALGAGKPCVMVPVGGQDQPGRVSRYQRAGIVLGSPLDADAMCAQALRIDQDPGLGERLVDAARNAGIRNDVGRAVEMLLELVD